MSNLVRYARIPVKMKREFLLLQGTGCRWKRCTFCDYWKDVSDTPFEVNRPVLEQVTGEFGVLDIINSGSCPELDQKTVQKIRQVAETKGIHTLWFEAHYSYRDQLEDFAKQFPQQSVFFRCGIESFDPSLRRAWNKGVPDSVTARKLAKHFRGVCLLVGCQGQTPYGIREDLTLAQAWFDYYSVNLFCPNSTHIHRDEALADWFCREMAPVLEADPKAEVLHNNTDLGVG